ncbi:16924_t:CDS:2 [Entrophospora sp. SA101]|nr:16924_t:CDS:2 [Entrophospora sp. SA101]
MTPLIRPYQRAPEMFGIPLKYIGLLTLCIQNSTLVTIMRYSRLGHKDALYFTSAAVFLSELSKFLICLYYAIKDQKIRKGYRSPRELFNEVFAHDARKLVVLAVLYTIQNNLQYIADEDDVMVFEKILGLTSVAIGCIAGVYFEKVLKGTPTSIWIRNVQLSFLSLFLLWLWEFGEKMRCQAIGGIIVVMEVKYGEYT